MSTSTNLLGDLTKWAGQLGLPKIERWNSLTGADNLTELGTNFYRQG